MARRCVERQQEEIVLALLKRHAERLSRSFSLPLRGVFAESPRVKRRYGICYEDGTIKLRLRHVRTGEFLRESSLVDTLCHELAHLRHFNHGRRFQKLYEQILAYARRHGIYRPGQPSRWRFEEERLVVVTRPSARPARRFGPVQLDLF